MNFLSDVKFNIQIKKITFCQYQLCVDDKLMVLSFPQLLQLRNKINSLTKPESLEKIIENENYVLLFVADKKHLLFLEIPKLLDLKEEISFCFYNY
ncbi:hypothetical protein [Polaribacter sargassicola]|uniref:hypothetical protein n=1 Tax=Polaribacter sargassicola TaxID=2836891 RepID=UPI001F3E25DC|nr:hypothetical protein [Polaribacter sp. DS7-9]MCG1035239.1 hypothetical protein [Polaribacter sp. DS7-9]